MCETYNGWTNRETWAVKLWLDNDEGMYKMAREYVRDGLAASPAPDWADTPDELTRQNAWTAGEAIHNLWDTITDPESGLMSADTILPMVRDVGSEYRVEWGEIGAAYLSELDEDES